MEDLGKVVETGRHQGREKIGCAWKSWEGMVYRCSGRGDVRPVYQLPFPGVQPSEWDPCVSLRTQSILVGDKRRRVIELRIRTIQREIFVPSSSDCCSTMDKYNFPSHSGFRRKEFRLNQCPCPGFESSIPLGVAPNRLSVNQCSFRFRINASCVLRRVLVCQASATTGRETYWGWLV